jgi:hypothetical protein
MSKNYIILNNEIYGKHKFSVLNSNEIFNREDMTNLIESIEGKIYNYDDISIISVVNLMDIDEINVLPHNLTKLEIKHSTLTKLTIPLECKKLVTIDIRETNLTEMPEIYFLDNLKTIIIQKSFIDKIPDRFPNSISSINLSENSLNQQNANITKFPKNVPIILLRNCYVNLDRNIPIFNEHILIFGGQRLVNDNAKITNYTIQYNEAKENIRNATNITKEPIIKPYNNPEQYTFTIKQPLNRDYEPPTIREPAKIKEEQMFNSSQTVHISSICNSVTRSVMKIIKLTDPIYKLSDEKQLIVELINEFYVPKSNGFFSKILNFLRSNHYMIVWVDQWSRIKDLHQKTKMTYGNLLARVWILIKNHKQKQDFIENVKIELESSVGVCFTGRFNRLVNSLIGFVDGITVGISIKEQLQIEIGKIIAKLGKGEMSYNECKKTIADLFEDNDVKEDQTITSYYKQSWIDALEDYNPDSEIMN